MTKILTLCVLVFTVIAVQSRASARRALVIDPSPVPSIAVGETVTLRAFLDGQPVTAKWSSFNTAVATVTASGVLTGQGAGTTTIRAQVKNVKADAAVTVTAPPGGPVDCVVSDWSCTPGPWSACSPSGDQTRTLSCSRTVVTPPSNGGQACPTPLTETRTETQACTPPPSGCPVSGGTSTSPTNLNSVITNQTSCTTFVLGDGWYAATTIQRAGVTVVAQNHCQAQVKPELSIQANNVTVDGVSVTAPGVALTVYNAGARVQNTCIQGFGKTQYGNGIWVFQQALNPSNLIRILDNTLDDWGGAQFSGGIAIGKADDNMSVPSAVSVEIVGNRITRGPSGPNGIYNAAIQSFHPYLATNNYVHTVNGTAMQNKTFGSRTACNEFVNVIGDGALYNRQNSNNVWEYNYVHDSDVGIDHFMGDSVVYRGNVIANVQHFGRVKDQGIGSTRVTLENNTFYNATGWAAFIWDASSGGTIANVLWWKNIFHTTAGDAINEPTNLDAAWDETDNIFWLSSRPSRTTGAGGTSRTLNPQISPPSFAPQDPGAAGYGAPWPLPCTR
jgi:Big-like domain-containing protein